MCSSDLIWLIQAGRGRGNPSTSPAPDLAALKKNSPAAIKIIGSANDQAVLKVGSFGIAPKVNCILIAAEVAISENRPVAAKGQCQGLPDRTGGILDGQVFGPEIISYDRQGCRSTDIVSLPFFGIFRRTFVLVSAGAAIVHVVADNSFVPAFSNQDDTRLGSGYDQLFGVIQPPLDEDQRRRWAIVWNGIYGILDFCKITAPV